MPGAPGRPGLLVISHVLPFPGNCGQQQRVALTIAAARRRFKVSLLTFVAGRQVAETKKRLSCFCDEPIVLESALRRNFVVRAAHKVAARVYTACTGLKESNYAIGRVEFSRGRLEKHLALGGFDCVLYEYIHAAPSTKVFRERGLPTVVDTHDILWHTRQKALAAQTLVPRSLRRRWLRQYREAEEEAWRSFDGVIAINRSEEAHIRQRVENSSRVFYLPMGIDLDHWVYCAEPCAPPRIGFYGGLGSRVNQEAVDRCLADILPRLWERFPSLEFWMIGSNPPARLRTLANERIKVTGYVERVEEILRTMSLVLCPWSGTYGFRSRLIEVMALGVPVVASPEAVDGMELEHQRGILFGETDAALAAEGLRVLSDPGFAKSQGALARLSVEKLYGMDSTYGRFTRELVEWLEGRKERKDFGS